MNINDFQFYPDSKKKGQAIMKKIVSMSKPTSKGVFWYIDDELLAFPFYDDYEGNGISKSGDTYNHKKLWKDIAPKQYNKYPYNYFPRGRVDFTNKGEAIIYMNPQIPESELKNIKIEFGISSTPKIKFDCSNHYKCYLDDGWTADY